MQWKPEKNLEKNYGLGLLGHKGNPHELRERGSIKISFEVFSNLVGVGGGEKTWKTNTNFVKKTAGIRKELREGHRGNPHEPR